MTTPPEAPVPFSLPYPGERMRWAIEVIGWSINQTADSMDMDRGTLRQMIRGTRFIPDVLAVWLETLAQMHLALPKPMGWRLKPGADPGRFGDNDPDSKPGVETSVLDNETV